MDMRNTKQLAAATAGVTEAKKRLDTAQAVVDRRREERDRAIADFRQAGGSLVELARVLGITKSAAQAHAKRAETAYGKEVQPDDQPA